MHYFIELVIEDVCFIIFALIGYSRELQIKGIQLSVDDKGIELLSVNDKGIELL